MNAVQTASSNRDKINSLIRSQKPDIQKEAGVTAENSAKQTNTIKNKDLISLSKTKNSVNEASKDNGKDKLEINEYLKILSRLENRLNLGELEEEDLDKISASLEERILALPDIQKNRLRNLEFFKKHGIENIKELKKTLFEMFKDIDERNGLFEFLRSPDFMAILLNEMDKPITYSAPLASTPVNASKNQTLPETEG
jgi:hypothetical protein